MRVMLILAAKEIRDGLRNRWLLAATLVLLALAWGLAFLGSVPTGHVGASALAVTVVSLASLTVFLLPLIALLLGFDAVVGEAERGTLLLLLAYPLRRWQVIGGKFLGHLALLAIATIIGYGSAGVVIGGEGGAAFVTLIVASVGLGASFLALGLLVSVVAGERATAAGIAVGLWLVLVLLYDLCLLAALAASQGQGPIGALFPWVLLANPTDVFRLLTLGSFAAIRDVSGLAGLPREALPSPALLITAMAAWVVVPLGLAVAAFQRRAV
jgi:Cu-processing system permease protein